MLVGEFEVQKLGDNAMVETTLEEIQVELCLALFLV